MAAACDVSEEPQTAAVNEELLEAQIVAQAITELQEIQAPASQGNEPGEIIDPNFLASLTNTVDVGDGVPGQTHVIYYIEDGAIPKSAGEGRKLVDSSVQANDYDIERRSGRLPARKRVIPVKFRDFNNVSDPETSDSDFDPHDYARPGKRSKIRKSSVMKQKALGNKPSQPVKKPSKAGRPKKNYTPTISTVLRSQYEELNNEVTNQVEEKYQMALKAAKEEAAKRRVELEKSSMLDEANSKNTTASAASATELEGGEDSVNDVSEPVVKTRRGPGRPRGPDWGSDFKCPDCDKSFKIKGNLRMHLRTHLNVRLFTCPHEDCGKGFSSNESLRRHTLAHQGIKPFQCDICQTAFSSNVALTEHRSRHFDEKPHECPYCQRNFRHISSYKRHVMTHSSQLPYECHVCHRKFAQAPYLRSHLKVHTGEKPYQCSICSKRFAHQSDVKRHRTTHSGEKPYQCSKCSARFTDVSSKGRHEKEHENNKRFTCALCSDTFKRSGQLRSHLARRHGQSLTVKLQKDPNATIAFRLGANMDLNPVNMSNQRIVSIIKNLHDKTIPAQTGVEGDSISAQMSDSDNQANEVCLDTSEARDDVGDILQLEKEVDPRTIEGEIIVPIDLQAVEIQESGTGQTYMTITDLADSLSRTDNTQEAKYQVLYEIGENGEQQQILVPYNEQAETLQLDYTSSHLIPNTDLEVTGATETIVESMQTTTETVVEQISDNTIIITDDAYTKHNDVVIENDSSTVMSNMYENITSIAESLDTNEIVNDSKTIDTLADGNDGNTSTDAQLSNGEPTSVYAETTATETTVASGIDFVTTPDFSKQAYYNWLTSFTESCKVVPMPLEASLFQKISQVHKTVSDVMATPFGVVADKENFAVLMNITKELSSIINEHLLFVMKHLDRTEESIESQTSSILK